MKKYGRIIRKSYFPNLFFKQEFKSAGQRKIHIFVRIKFDFYNTSFCKNFPLSFSKEKQPGNSGFFPELKPSGLMPSEPVNKKSMSLDPEHGKSEPLTLINKLISPASPYFNFRFPEPITSGFTFFNPVPLRLINHKFTACILRSPYLTPLDPVTHKYTYFNNSAYFTRPSDNFTSLNFKNFKLKFFRNSSKISISKIRTEFFGTRLIRNELIRSRFVRTEFQIIGSGENYFLKENLSFFTLSGLPAAHNIVSQKVISAAHPPVRSPVHILAAASQRRKHSGSEQPKKVIREKQDLTERTEKKDLTERTEKKDLTERKVKQDHKELTDHKELINYRPWGQFTEKLKPRGDVPQFWINKAESPVLSDLINNSRKLPDFKRIQNINLCTSVQVLIPHFLEKTAFGLNRKYSTGSESGKIDRNTMHEQKKNAFMEPSTNNVFRQYTEAITELRARTYKKTLVPSIQKQTKKRQAVLKLNSFFILRPNSVHQKVHAFNWLTALTCNTEVASQLNSQLKRQVISTPGSIVTDQLSSQEPEKLENMVFVPHLPAAIRPALNVPQIHNKTLGIKEKLRHLGQNFLFHGDIQGKRPNAEIKGLKTFYWRFEPVISPFSSTKEIYSYLQQVFHVFNYTEARKFSNMLRHPEDRKSTGKATNTTDSLTDNYRLSDHHVADHYTSNPQKIESKRELKTKKQYLGQINKLQSKLLQPYFLRDLETINETIPYRLKKTEASPYSDTQNIIPRGTAPPVPGLHKTYVSSPRQNYPLYIMSAYRGIHPHPVTGEVNYPISSIQNYPAVLAFNYKKTYSFKYSATRILNQQAGPINYLSMLSINSCTQGKTQRSSTTLNNYLEVRTFLEKKIQLEPPNLSLIFPKMEASAPLHRRSISEYFHISNFSSGVNTPAATENFLTLSHNFLNYNPNPAHRDTFSSNGLFSDRPPASSVPYISGKISTASGKKAIPTYSLSEYASLRNYAPLRSSQSPVFAQISGTQSNTETGSSNTGSPGYETASIPHFNEKQKLNGQKFPYLKTARRSLSHRNGQRGNKGEDFLQRNSVNSLRREKSKLQGNKNMDTLAELQKIKRISSAFILFARLDFTEEMKGKNILPISKTERKPEDRKNISKRLLFGFKTVQGFEKTSKSHMYSGQKSPYFVFPAREEAGKPPGIVASGISGKKRSELMHAGESKHKPGTEELVYGTQKTLLEEVKNIEKIVFETRETVSDHLESHFKQAAGKAGQVMDIEQMSEKIMQTINRRLKIEAERRGIF